MWQATASAAFDAKFFPEVDPSKREKVTFADLKIRVINPITGASSLQTFAPNPVQELYLDMLAEAYEDFDWRHGLFTLRGIREDILKARQQGFSTLWLALYFLDTINNPYVETHIYAHDGPTTERLFEIVKRFYDELPAHKKRPLEKDNAESLVFLDNGSGFYVGLVGGRSLGRGGTVNNAHLSERAWSKAYAKLEVGLFPSIPQMGNITRETTANGYNEYYRTRKARSKFHNRFFGWNLTPHYRSEPEDNFSRRPDEERLARAFGLDNAQLMWRRDKLAESAETAKTFTQEYPLTEEEAFLSSGNPYFDRDILQAWNTEIQHSDYDPLTDIVLAPDHFPHIRRAYANEDLLIWREPMRGHDYIVTSDPAGGINTDGNRDACSCDVIDSRTWEQVAHLHGLWEPHEFALMIAELGQWYNMALIGVLRMNHGGTVLDTLLHTCHYPAQRGNENSGIYYYEDSHITQALRRTNMATRQSGWPENARTKPLMLDKLGEYLRVSPGLKVYSRRSVPELLTYIHLPGGQSGAEPGAHDDCVSSLAVGAVLLSLRFDRAHSGDDIPKPREPNTPGGTRQRGR